MGKKKPKKINVSIDADHNILVKQMKVDKDITVKKLINKFGNKVYNKAYAITGDHNESEEVFQDVFVTVYKKIDTLRDMSALSSWIYAITTNLAKMKIRQRAKNQLFLEDVNSVTPIELVSNCNVEKSENGMTCLLNTEVQNVLKEAISDLPSKYKTVIILNDLNNFSLRKTSDILNISIPAVKSRLHRARQQLKRKLDVYFLEQAN
jgi:RNA polymerase sigma-70 factor (ECF subfamily)